MVYLDCAAARNRTPSLGCQDPDAEPVRAYVCACACAPRVIEPLLWVGSVGAVGAWEVF